MRKNYRLMIDRKFIYYLQFGSNLKQPDNEVYEGIFWLDTKYARKFFNIYAQIFIQEKF